MSSNDKSGNESVVTSKLAMLIATVLAEAGAAVSGGKSQEQAIADAVKTLEANTDALTGDEIERLTKELAGFTQGFTALDAIITSLTPAGPLIRHAKAPFYSNIPRHGQGKRKKKRGKK